MKDNSIAGCFALRRIWLGIWSDGGINLRYEHGTTSYYQVDGYSFSVFKEF